MLKNKKMMILGSSLAVALVLGGVVTYGLLSRAATPTDVAPAVTCMKNQAASNKVTTYSNYTSDSIYYCFQGKGSTSKLMLTGDKYASPASYRGPLGANYTSPDSIRVGDLIFYQSPKFSYTPPKGSPNPETIYDVLIGVPIGNGEMIRLDDTRTKVIKTSLSDTFYGSKNTMQYKFVEGRKISEDTNLRSFSNPITLVPNSSTYTQSQQLENLLLVNFLQIKRAPNYTPSTTTYGNNEVQQIRYIQNLVGTLTGSGKDTMTQVGPYTWSWIYESIDKSLPQTGLGI